MKDQVMYGYPISSILFRIMGLILLFLIVVFLGFSVSVPIGLASFFILPPFFYLFIFRFRNSFTQIREKIISEMIQYADLKGNEHILDLGTGSGYVAIHFAKKISQGRVIGIDKYNMRTDGPVQWFMDELKINFFGKSLQIAEMNAKIEQVEDAIRFLKADLMEPFPFEPNRFHVIVSSQFLYCIPSKELRSVLEEIDRVLKKQGTLVFFESSRFMNWDIKKVKEFFSLKGYQVSIKPLTYFSNKCIFIAHKP